MSKFIYTSRMAPGLNEEQRSKLIFEESVNLEEELKRKTAKVSRWSSIFGLCNTGLNLAVIVSSAIIVIISSVVECQNIPVIVLGGIIFAISGANELLKLGSRGFNYLQGMIRLRRIRGQIRDIIYMFHTYTNEQILAFLSTFRSEIDDIDLDLYKSSMTGEAKYEGGALKISQPNTPTRDSIPGKENSHIHIHIDNSPNNSPSSSPRNSLDLLPKEEIHF